MKKFVTISQVAEVNPKIPNEYSKDLRIPVTFLPMAAVSEQGIITTLEESIYCDVVKGYRYFENGDIIVAKITPCMENGKAAYVEDLPHNIGFGSTEFHVIRPSNKIDGRYLFYMIWSPDFRSVAGRNMTGTAGQKRVPTDFIKRYKIPLPPLEEQKWIAAILDKADRVRRKRQEAIRLTEELGRSIFLDMFGDPVTNPKGWEIVRLENLLNFMTSGSRGWAKYYAEKGKIFLRIQNVKNGRLILEDVAFVDPPDNAEGTRTKVKEGDVLVSITADLGRTAVIPKGMIEAYINQHLVILRVNQDQLSPIYLSSFLSSEGGKKQFSQLDREGVKSGLNFSDLKGLSIVFPPIEQQKRYEETYDRQINQLLKQKGAFQESENLFNSLLQRAFRGEL